MLIPGQLSIAYVGISPLVKIFLLMYSRYKYVIYLYYIVIWQSYTLQNDYHNKSSNHLSYKIITVLLTTLFMLYITSHDFFFFFTKRVKSLFEQKLIQIRQHPI